MPRVGFALACGLALAAATPACATEISLPNATFRGGIRSWQAPKSFTGIDSREYSDTFGTVSASIASAPILTVQASGTSTDIGISTIAEAHARYYFVLLSPIPTEVHVIIDTLTLAAGFGNYYADAEVDLNANDGTFNRTLAHAHACSSGPACGIGSDKTSDGGRLEYTLAAN